MTPTSAQYLEWARAAGMFYADTIFPVAYTNPVLERYAALAFAAGMEEAAEIADEYARPAHTYASENADRYRGFQDGAQSCANAIRRAAKEQT